MLTKPRRQRGAKAEGAADNRARLRRDRYGEKVVTCT
jgi:hypothetical protein